MENIYSRFCTTLKKKCEWYDHSRSHPTRALSLSQARLVDSSSPVMWWSFWPAGVRDLVTPTPCVSSQCSKLDGTVAHSSAVHTSLPSLPTPAGFQTGDLMLSSSSHEPGSSHRPVDHHHLDVCSHCFHFHFSLDHNLTHIYPELSVCMPVKHRRVVSAERTPLPSNKQQLVAYCNSS